MIRTVLGLELSDHWLHRLYKYLIFKTLTELTRQNLDDYWIIKMELSNSIVSDNTIGGDGQDWLNSIEIIEGELLVSGSSTSGASGDKTEPSNGFFDFWQIQLESNGNTLWQQSIGGSGYDNLVDAIP